MNRRMWARTMVLAALVGTASAASGEVGVNLNINVGSPPVRVVAPVQPVVIEEPPEFIVPSALGFYVAVGVPYDLYMVSDTYYLSRGGKWYRSHRYNGPWTVVSYRRLPGVLHKHKVERIRVIRDTEYRHYKGRKWKPEKEYRKEEHRRWKEDKRREKEERKERRHRDD